MWCDPIRSPRRLFLCGRGVSRGRRMVRVRSCLFVHVSGHPMRLRIILCQEIAYPAPSFTRLFSFTTGTMQSQFTDSERTVNVHRTCSERGIERWKNWGKDRIFFFSCIAGLVRDMVGQQLEWACDWKQISPKKETNNQPNKTNNKPRRKPGITVREICKLSET